MCDFEMLRGEQKSGCETDWTRSRHPVHQIAFSYPSYNCSKSIKIIFSSGSH